MRLHEIFDLTNVHTMDDNMISLDQLANMGFAQAHLKLITLVQVGFQNPMIPPCVRACNVYESKAKQPCNNQVDHVTTS